MANLRESIEKLINKPDEGKSPLDVKGKVRNLKDGRVEIICKGNDLEVLYNKLEEWKNKQEFDIKDVKVNDTYDLDIESFGDFTVERADDLSEMVLALRGAGYRFAESTTALKEINDNLLERDKKVTLGRLLTLHYELTHNIREFDEQNTDKQRILLIALKSNVSSPVISKEEFAHLLVEVFIQLQGFQNTEEFRSILDPLKENLKTLRKIVDDELILYNIRI